MKATSEPLNKTANSVPTRIQVDADAEDNYSSLLKKSANEVLASKAKRYVKKSVSPIKNKKFVINVKPEVKNASIYSNFDMKQNLP